MGFLPSAGEAVTWQTLHLPARTFQFKWTVLDVSPPPEEDNTSYRKGPDRNKDSSVGLRPLTVSLRPAGLDFGAILVKPSGSSSDGRLPLVVFVHGPSALAVCPLTREGARELMASVRLLSQVVLTLSSQQNGTAPQLDWFDWASRCSWVSPVLQPVTVN